MLPPFLSLPGKRHEQRRPGLGPEMDVGCRNLNAGWSLSLPASRRTTAPLGPVPFPGPAEEEEEEEEGGTMHNLPCSLLPDIPTLAREHEALPGTTELGPLGGGTPWGHSSQLVADDDVEGPETGVGRMLAAVLRDWSLCLGVKV